MSRKPGLSSLVTYWKHGATIIQANLDKAIAARPEDAPMPLSPEEAEVWHRAQAEAYRHALEMMGPPPESATEEEILRTNVMLEQHAGGLSKL